ncbi:type III-A CRISPR-associated protein Cas10/Csm1, partial [Staphylococcus epidermidis]|nr:type III-A CRISPR-associated protein Cas10/Csm1 [Staphylococcus epidermidis]
WEILKIGKKKREIKIFKESNIEYPKTENIQYSSGNYTTLMKDMSHDLEHKLSIKEGTFPSLLQWTESLWQYVPSSTNKNQLIDISLYDHSRITCAIASCIFDYLNENNIHNYKDELFSKYENTKSFYQKEAFLLLSMDMSGIQDFIYNLSGVKALKSQSSLGFILNPSL